VKKLAPLFALYFAQGLPFGVQSSALPLLLRQRGASLQTIGFASLLALPWLAKALWAPLVDRYGSARFGRRKSWIVPMQLLLALSALLAAQLEGVVALAGIILAMNFFAATQDIAVDALAVSSLEPQQLGPANAIQVVGYKLGMLTGGGLLVWASDWIGWQGLFYAMAALMVGVLLITLRVREAGQAGSQDEELDRDGGAGHGLATIARRLRDAVAQPGSAALLLVMLTYKTGETLADAMWKPMLLDRGFRVAQIGLWSGTLGMLCSLLGSAGAGWLARSVALPRALVWIASVRAVSVAGEWWISATPTTGASAVIAVTCLEHLVGGAITTVVFALMMRHTDRQIGATHYTLLASLEVLGKLPLATLSGVLAVWLGYPRLFGLGTVLCVGFAVLARALSHRLSVVAQPARQP
jgi:MFS transporter, PAT family, beta-lactamase induction signal transducer AmpG